MDSGLISYFENYKWFLSPMKAVLNVTLKISYIERPKFLKTIKMLPYNSIGFSKLKSIYPFSYL